MIKPTWDERFLTSESVQGCFSQLRSAEELTQGPGLCRSPRAMPGVQLLRQGARQVEAAIAARQLIPSSIGGWLNLRRGLGWMRYQNVAFLASIR